MEVLENSNHLTESENQPTGSNYVCRLSRDLNPSANAIAQSKREADISFLMACKSQLSSEVIRWKAESLRLQRERDSARLRMRELELLAVKFSDRTKELEVKLSEAEVENEQLRTKTVLTDKANFQLYQKLAQSLDKYHSYPWSESPTKPANLSLPRQDSGSHKSEEVLQEDWKEVSQKLLRKMKEEMRELQELSNHFSIQGEEEMHAVLQNSRESDEQLEEYISSLLCETESLKHHLLEQRRKLQSLINNFVQSSSHLQKETEFQSGLKDFKTVISGDKSIQPPKSKVLINKFSRPSDESFRVYFNKQLGVSQDVNKMNKTVHLFLESAETQKDIASSNESNNTVSNLPKQQAPPSPGELTSETPKSEEERVCPICQAPFGVIISQKEFEEHVLDHLEVESASLMDQYVVL